MDSVMLSRAQFGLTMAFHYIFVPLTIGLSVALVTLEGLYLLTGDERYKGLTKFFASIFALNFAIGVATGLPMEFQFGTNWAQYSRFVGDVFGSALAAEGIFAFFLESGLLGVVLFGWDRVPRGAHYAATILLSLGSHFSAVWIIVANSWMQTPDGYRIVGEGAGMHAVLTDFGKVVFNPSTLLRLTHTLAAAWQAGAFLVLSVSAWYLLHERFQESARLAFKVGLVIAGLAATTSIVTGDVSGRQVARYQPAKLAAMEGLFEVKTPRAPEHLVGWVDTDEQRVYGPAIPGLLSWLVYHDVNHPVTGLQAFPRTDWPAVNTVFQTFHLMVAIGSGTFALAALGIFLWWRGSLFEKRWLLWVFVFAIPFVLLANELGWFTAELGRQPWLVYNVLRTEEGGSPSVSPGEVWASLSLFGAVYLIVGALYVFLLNDRIRRGPTPGELAKEGEDPLTPRHRADFA
jgi:cytochrome bd ubiquinol oxidase subunit I